MRKTKYQVKVTAQFKKDYKLALKRRMNVKLLEDVVAALAMGEPLPEKNKDHGLSGKWAGRQSIVKIDKPTFLFSFPKCERAAFRIVLEALPFPNEGKLG